MLEMWKFISGQFERWTLRFCWKIWGFTFKKLKLGRDHPYVDGPLRKILKHNIKVDNNPWWLVPVSFLYDNLHWNKKGCFVFYLNYCTYSHYVTWMRNHFALRMWKYIQITHNHWNATSRNKYILNHMFVRQRGIWVTFISINYP